METNIYLFKCINYDWDKTGILLVIFLFLMFSSSCRKDELNQEAILETDNNPRSALAISSSGTVYYGPKTFSLGSVHPFNETEIIGSNNLKSFGSKFVLKIQNGDSKKTETSELEVYIDGILTISSKDFKKNGNSVEKEISGLTEESNLRVQFNGPKGCFINLIIEGTIINKRTLDSLALVALYNSTGGPNWANKENWLSSKPISEWYGITVENNRVSFINLSNNNLSGILPVEIGNLTELKILELNRNNLRGNLPTQIGNLINLTALALGDNQFDGAIPVEIGNMVNLKIIILFGNQFSGNIPSQLGNLDLYKIDFSINKLTGNLPSTIWNLTNLVQLDLSGNYLTGSIPPEIKNLTALYSLYLDYNQFSGSIPQEIGELSNLTYLWLSNNQFSGILPTQVGNLSNLRYLWLDNNELIGTMPTEISNLTNLLEIRLSSNQLTGAIPKEIGNLIDLQKLHLDNNQFIGSIPLEIGHLRNLKSLSLNNNQLSGAIPIELYSLTNLNYLLLNNNSLSGNIPKEIGNLTNLSQLYLENNQLSGSIPTEINNLETLSVLLLNDNQFVELPSITIGVLEALFIHNNRLTFESIEPNITNTKLNFRYFPQDSIGIKQDIILNEGQDFNITVTCGGEYNHYQWYKNGIPILEATSSTYIIPTLQVNDVGSYNCVVTNTQVPGLSIYSRPTKLYVTK
jgi:Leucine-rich repeat (LRR) protein